MTEGISQMQTAVVEYLRKSSRCGP